MTEQYNFSPEGAFSMTMRVFRGGGLTKDAIYLRGLVELMSYLERGGDLKPLFIGKIAVKHIPIVTELRWREVLSEPILTPRFMNSSAAIEKLKVVAAGLDLLDLAGSTNRTRVKAKSKK